MVRYAIGYAAHEQRLEPAQAATSQNDQIDFLSFRDFENQVNRISCLFSDKGQVVGRKQRTSLP